MTSSRAGKASARLCRHGRPCQAVQLLAHRLGGGRVLSLLRAFEPFRQLLDPRRVGLVEVQQAHQHGGGVRRRNLLDEVAATGRRKGAHVPPGQASDVGLQLADLFIAERRVQRAPVRGVLRRVVVHRGPPAGDRVAGDHDALGTAECGGRRAGGDHIGVAQQGPESAPPAAPGHRAGRPKLGVDGVRVPHDPGVERVEVPGDLVVDSARHVDSFHPWDWKCDAQPTSRSHNCQP